MKVDNKFASRVAAVAAEIVADGCPHGTWDKPDWVLPVGAGFESAIMRAAQAVWGGPGWWRKNMTRASQCLRSIRHLICDGTTQLSFSELETQSRERWDALDVNERTLMLLFCSQALKQKQ